MKKQKDKNDQHYHLIFKCEETLKIPCTKHKFNIFLFSKYGELIVVVERVHLIFIHFLLYLRVHLYPRYEDWLMFLTTPIFVLELMYTFAVLQSLVDLCSI